MPEILIDKVGSLGDGMGMLNGKPVFVPRTLAGETVKASGEGARLELDSVASPSPDRIEPLCKHFGTCGGCSLQHMAAQIMLEWKRQEVITSFSRAQLKPDVKPCISSEAHSRRRVTFSCKRDGSMQLGFNVRGSTELVDIEECPILSPKIEESLKVFASLSASLLRGREEIQISVTAADNGLDLNFLLETPPTEDMLAAFVRAFAKTKFLRAGINGEVIVERDKPLVNFGKAQVAITCGGFLQAVPAAEQAMADVVMQHLRKSKRVVDLFSGSGTFALRLAPQSKVHAVETEVNALAALKSATGTEGFKTITTEVRDLDELPLTLAELKPFDGICLDPPRAGAEAQIAEIAKADIRRVAYVSCNPVTLARDAAVLVKAGYTLESVTPVDQFLFSPHIEAVALFTKAPAKANRSIFR